MGNTINYYNENAKKFIDGTVSVDFRSIHSVSSLALSVGLAPASSPKGGASGGEENFELRRKTLRPAKASPR